MTVYGAARLAGCHSALVSLVTSVGAERDVQVVQGARSLADERAAIASGHSHLHDPMHSKHVVDPVTRPLALAVDLAPWPVKWTDHAGFVQLAAAVKAKALALGIAISWGGDWPKPFDFDHYELKAA